MDAVEKRIRDEFPGKANVGLRAELRQRWSEGGASSIEGAGRAVALTASGLASLRAVATLAHQIEDEDQGR